MTSRSVSDTRFPQNLFWAPGTDGWKTFTSSRESCRIASVKGLMVPTQSSSDRTRMCVSESLYGPVS